MIVAQESRRDGHWWRTYCIVLDLCLEASLGSPFQMSQWSSQSLHWVSDVLGGTAFDCMIFLVSIDHIVTMSL